MQHQHTHSSVRCVCVCVWVEWMKWLLPHVIWSKRDSSRECHIYMGLTAGSIQLCSFLKEYEIPCKAETQGHSEVKVCPLSLVWGQMWCYKYSVCSRNEMHSQCKVANIKKKKKTSFSPIVNIYICITIQLKRNNQLIEQIIIININANYSEYQIISLNRFL